MRNSVLVLFLVTQAVAQEGTVSAPVPESSRPSQSSYHFSTIFDRFRNQSFKTSGMHYGAELGYESVSEYKIFAGLTALYGQVRSKNVHELGNPYVGGELMFTESGPFQTWGILENRFSQPEGLIAARHNTLIGGFNIRYARWQTYSTIGADYHHRYGESDSQLDVKDIVSLKFNLGRKLTRKISVEGDLLWYRAYGVQTDRLVIARVCDWAGIGPGVSYRLGLGAQLKTSLLFPVHQTRDAAETEVALWDSSMPNTNELTWRTNVGVQF